MITELLLQGEADMVISMFVEKKFAAGEKRAKGCRCHQCQEEYLDCRDRLDWVFLDGRWKEKTPVGIIIKGGKKVIVHRDGTFAPDD